MFTNKDIADRFGVSREASRQWAGEFADYLSPTGNPEKGRQRNYTDDDLLVFALVADMKAAGKHTPEIHAALAAGQRGTLTASSGIIPRSDSGINALRLELSLARQQWTQERGVLEQQIAAERSRADRSQGKVELLERQLQEREDTIRGLYRQLALFEAKDFSE